MLIPAELGFNADTESRAVIFSRPEFLLAEAASDFLNEFKVSPGRPPKLERLMEGVVNRLPHSSSCKRVTNQLSKEDGDFTQAPICDSIMHYQGWQWHDLSNVYEQPEWHRHCHERMLFPLRWNVDILVHVKEASSVALTRRYLAPWTGSKRAVLQGAQPVIRVVFVLASPKAGGLKVHAECTREDNHLDDFTAAFDIWCAGLSPDPLTHIKISIWSRIKFC
ncbi:hypothetical protein V8B97DRAFT_2108065 [Scleroderma yunnanense]